MKLTLLLNLLMAEVIDKEKIFQELDHADPNESVIYQDVEYCPLFYGIKTLDCEIVERLLFAGADASHISQDTEKLSALQILAEHYLSYSNEESVGLMSLLVELGADPNHISPHPSSALMTYWEYQDLELVDQLLSFGAELKRLQISSMAYAAAKGDADKITELIQKGNSLDNKDYAGHTALDTALLFGNLEVAEILFQAGSILPQPKPLNDPLLQQLIKFARFESFAWLRSRGVASSELRDSYSSPITPLELCAQISRSPTDFDSTLRRNSLKLLTDALEEIEDPAVARELLKLGASPNYLEAEVRKTILGFKGCECDVFGGLDKESFRKGSRLTFGSSNPEACTDPYRLGAIKCRYPGYSLAGCFFLDAFEESPPYWTADRFGQSLIPIQKGGFLEIGGSHFDFTFTAHFNDVIYHDGKGDFTLYTYPNDVFPTTAFHAALEANGEILIFCGSQHYGSGFKTIYCLDLSSFEISQKESKGAIPSPMNQPYAYLHLDGTVRLLSRDFASGEWCLDLVSLEWSEI